MPELLTPDICVIGAGSGGLAVAAAATAFGVPVVLVEKGRMGGDCLNTGCVPSKSLIAAAKRAHAMAEARPFGVWAPRIEIDFAKVQQHVQEVIAAVAPNVRRSGSLRSACGRSRAWRFGRRRADHGLDLAIGQRLNIRAFAGIVVPYPTLAEVGKRAALSYFTPSLTNSMVRRVIV